MAHGKVHLTSNQIALPAFGLSALSSGFAVYQWWTSAEDEHVRAAIELSDRYIDQWVNMALLRGQVDTGYANRTSLDPVDKQIDRIEYVSLLERNGLLDWNYLSQRIVCDIVHNADSESLPEAEKFKSRHPNACLADAKTDTTDASSPANTS